MKLNISTPSILTALTSLTTIYLIILAPIIIWVSIKAINFPYGIDYGEAPLMDQARRIMFHEPLYKADFNSPPYVVSNYPPLYPILVAGLHSIFKISLFQLGRVISFAFSILCTILIAAFGFYITKKRALGALAAAVFIGNPYVTIWSSFARVDMMALAFSLLGLLLLFRNRDSLIWVMISCLCFLFSIYTRQTYLLAAPLAGFLWLYQANHRRGLLFLLFFIVITLLVFGSINVITNGGFYMNIIVANINHYNPSRFFSMLAKLFILWPFILFVTGIVVGNHILKIVRNRIGRIPIKEMDFPLIVLLAYSLGALFVAITAIKIGSNTNYFLELFAACALWMAIVAERVIKGTKIQGWIFTGVLLIQLVWVLVGSFFINSNMIANRQDRIGIYNKLYERISSTTQSGTVLSDDYLDMVVKSGRFIYYQPFEYGQLYQAGLWDAQDFTEALAHKNFPLVVIGGDTLEKPCCWPPPVVNALKESYQIESIPGIILLTPK